MTSLEKSRSLHCVSTNWCGRPWSATDYPSEIEVMTWAGEALIVLHRTADDADRLIRFSCSRGGLRPLVRRIRRNARIEPFTAPTDVELGVEVRIESLRSRPTTPLRNFLLRNVKLEIGPTEFGTRLAEEFSVPPGTSGLWLHVVADPLNVLRIVLDTINAAALAERLEGVAVELGDNGTQPEGTEVRE